MRWRWMVMVMALAMCAAPAAGAVAQERPDETRPAAVADPAEGEMADGAGDLEDLDGLGLLLAAHARDGAGSMAAHGPGGGMGPGRRGGRGMGPGASALPEQLKLTDYQKTKIADVHDRRQREAIPIQGDLKIASLDLRKLMRADRPDQRAIDAQIDRIATLRGALQKAHVAGMLEVRALLTPAQQKLMREHHEGMRGRHLRGGRGMHGGPGMHGAPGRHEGHGRGATRL